MFQVLSFQARRIVCWAVALFLTLPGWTLADDYLREMQTAAIVSGQASWGYWGTDDSVYSNWKTHSNRLIPVYSFGGELTSYKGVHSVYRDANAVTQLYGKMPRATWNPHAEYFDQTDIYRWQMDAVRQGKRRIILFVFDGMDWQTTRAAAIYKSQRVAYEQGRGTGLHVQDYRGTETDFGFMVTAPHNEGTNVDVVRQLVLNPNGTTSGGYAWELAGSQPWLNPRDRGYLIGASPFIPHAYTDSSSSATSMNAGIKTFNGAVNVDSHGKPVSTIAHELQQKGWSVGSVTNVPISHATPACTYAVNVSRDDYQDLTRDMLGIPSVSHPQNPLPGMEVVLGCGWGENLSLMDADFPEAVLAQGDFIAGNLYLADRDLSAIDAQHGGRYEVALRTPGQSGSSVLQEATQRAIASRRRLFGMFGVGHGHLPFCTADRQFDPTIGINKGAQTYSPADIQENPTLAEMAIAALDVLSKDDDGFWLMIEAGDVDWANHDNNLDNSIGAVLSGDDAFKSVVDWIEAHGGWSQTALILTADHGHYLQLTRPEALLARP